MAHGRHRFLSWCRSGCWKRRGRLCRETSGALIHEESVSNGGFWRKAVRREGGLLERLLVERGRHERSRRFCGSAELVLH